MPFVNVHLIERAYAGPEEGGRYYECGEAVKSIPVTTYRQAKRALRLAKRIVDAKNVGRRPLHSVLSQGLFQASIDREPAKDFPDQVPQYE